MYKSLATCLLVFLLTASAYSEDKPAFPSQATLESITVEEALSLALAHSVEMRKTVVSIRDDETRLAEEHAWNWLSPNLSLRGGVDVDTGEPAFSLGVGIDLKDIMGAGNKRIRTLKFSINEERKNLEAIKASVTIKVTSAYKSYKAAREKVKALEETLKNDEKLLSEMEASGSRTEKLLIRSMVNQDKVALITARQELDMAEANLRELLGLVS